MSVKSEGLFQVPDWIERDRRKVAKGNAHSLVHRRTKPNVKADRNILGPNQGFQHRPLSQTANQQNSGTQSGTTSNSSARAEIEVSGVKSNGPKRFSGILSNSRKDGDNSRSNCSRPNGSVSKVKSKSAQQRKLDLSSRTRHHASPKSNVRKDKRDLPPELPADDLEDLESIEDDEVIFIDNNNQTEPPQNRAENVPVSDLLLYSGRSSYETVFEIDLHAQNLEQVKDLEKFQNLRILDLSCNRITKIENLEHNKNVRELKLYDNRLSEVCGLESLEEICHLQLQHNRISKIGSGFAGKRKLKILRLDSNRLEGIDTRELAPLSGLVSLDISCNMLEEITCVNALPLLEELNASQNRLEVISDMGRCKKLKELNISANHLKDISGLKGLSSLTVLSVADNSLGTSSLKVVGKLHSLQVLDISGNNVTNLNFIPDQFPSLEVLYAARNKLGDFKVLSSLQKCSSLTELILEGNPVCLKEADYSKYRQDLTSTLASLEMIDRVHVKRHRSAFSDVPLMRPMSASSVMSARQVENQLKHVEDEVALFHDNLSARFESLRMSMSTLPSESPSRVSSALESLSPSMTPRSVTPGSARSQSRCGSRQRIADAQAFAATHF
ncbi:Protein phosphatase 1 regulatory subunit SDS22-like [Holothuria leucospilota]|uniref:Protein phosphatase 1 regulatory subunit SDS22-like n=1 Tax=Holothuria leucospilota TaxID=206669 RepID=A0A9Q1C4D1_HOLLE|nr:Protein phosphatase 1 regulatory subunit SDS22-like [Holothuria leucospilota]